MDNEIGVIIRSPEGKPDFPWFDEFGLKVCQVSLGRYEHWSEENSDYIREEARKRGIRVVGTFAGCRRDEQPHPGPPAHFAEDLKRAGDLAKRAGIPAVIVEFGFLPQNLSDPTFDSVAAVFRDLAQYLDSIGLQFWIETTEEKPITLLRLLEAMGTSNVGVNFDPGNLTVYGTANALDALEVYGHWVRNVHAKDGFLPTKPLELGEQIIVGKGRVDFPAVFRKLRDLGFKGEIVIEREVRGDQQRLDIIETVRYLRDLLPRI